MALYEELEIALQYADAGDDSEALDLLGELLQDRAVSAGRCAACGKVLESLLTYQAGAALVCHKCSIRLGPSLALVDRSVRRVMLVKVPDVP